jgi:hypothetical protein
MGYTIRIGSWNRSIFSIPVLLTKEEKLDLIQNINNLAEKG